MKEADRSGARWAVIIGDEELASGEVMLKDLKDGDQQRVGRNEVIRIVHERHGLEMEAMFAEPGHGR